ncbi:ATP synthase mitochondrial F1 complex assembly factor 1 [Eumeta japonica]|uniref:ATP synthase mitochondrial F1 complex assembly factor 1 n=1 Tax=Eumeta variegata TaxID=151549 RepID=A0A4C1W7V6_EUMVA|nr:ATP synthase mitochondrial F1 complex assembly factor 1 [Eumeta japonica]
MTSSSNLEKVFENLEKNPYYEKYAERIAALQRTSPQEFLERVNSSQNTNKIQSPSVPDTRQYSSVLNPKERLQEANFAPDAKLETIFKIDLVKDKNSTEIQSIWEEYHKQKDVIAATIPVELYSKINKMMRDYPTFLFPLPRAQGYEFIMCQNSGHSIHFTPLLAYQVHAENAPECLTIRHYTELEDKGIVLMRGEYDQNVLNGREAQYLANQFQLYYGTNDANTPEATLLHSFTHNPESFRHMDLVERLENITLPASEN